MLWIGIYNGSFLFDYRRLSNGIENKEGEILKIIKWRREKRALY